MTDTPSQLVITDEDFYRQKVYNELKSNCDL